MSGEEREAIERALLEHCQQEAFAVAAGRLIRSYGPEILRFIASIVRDGVAADETFSAFCEQVLTGLPTFHHRSTYRTWAYVVARNAALQHRAGTKRRARRELTGEAGAALEAVEHAVRTETVAYLRTETKSRFAQLREQLSEEDRALLVLRVDRELEWLEIAQVLEAPLATDGAPTASELKRRAGKLRKRFQTVKERLIALGKREGLFGDEHLG